MKKIYSKNPRLRLDSERYGKLHRQVLERDGWKCQRCGATSNLQVHHQRPRSHGGDDSDRNLITLCIDCHLSVHASGRVSLQ